MWVWMEEHGPSDQYPTSAQVWATTIQRFRNYSLLKTLTKIVTNADNTTTLAAIALLVFSYQQSKNYYLQVDVPICR